MNKKSFKKELFNLKEKRNKQISDIYSLLLQFREKIDDYNNQSTYDKLLIETLLGYCIISLVSNLQGFLEDTISLFEMFIVTNDIDIRNLHKKIYNLIYQKHKEIIIKDGLIYGEKISTKLGPFIDKTNTNNIILDKGHTSSNSIDSKNIKLLLNMLLIDFDKLVSNIDINIGDYKGYINKRIGDKYILDNEKKKTFLCRLIDDIKNIRHQISHGRDPEIAKDPKKVFLLFSLGKEYIIDRLFVEIEIQLRNFIMNNAYIKK